MSDAQKSIFRYVTLVLLTLQATVTLLSLRYSRKNSLNKEGTSMESPMYFASTLILCTEVTKLFLAFTLLKIQLRSSIGDTFQILYAEIICKPRDTSRLTIPSTLYVIQDNLIIYALTYLDAATYQATYQMRILTTALFATILLKKELSVGKWLALAMLTTGVILVQVKPNQNDMKTFNLHQHWWGIVSVIGATVTSGLAGVYQEKLLKDGQQPLLLVRSAQLGLFTTLLALMGMLIKDVHNIGRLGFFHGYNRLVFFLIVLQAFGGILVAATMKFADNILKTFASSLSIVLSCLYSYWIMDDLDIEVNFVLGTIVIIAATSVYGFLSFQKDLVAKELLPSVVESRKIIPYQRITQYKIV